MIIRATRRSGRFWAKAIHLFLTFFKKLSIGRAPGNEPATSRSAGKRSTEIKMSHNLDQWCSSDFLLSASSPSVLSHLLLNCLWEYPISLEKGYPFLVYHWLAITQKQKSQMSPTVFFLCWDRPVFTKLRTSQAFTEHLLCTNNAYQFYTYLISS